MNDVMIPELVNTNVTLRSDALVFSSYLLDDKEEAKRMALGIEKGLRKLTDGHQWYWGDLWRILEALGLEWAEHCPNTIPFSTANTWRTVGKRFPPEDRIFKGLQFSHYAAVRSKALSLEIAHDILTVANREGWTEDQVAEQVKSELGEEPKPKKLKVITCPHCDRPAIEGLECWGCSYDVVMKAIKELEDELAQWRDMERVDA